MHLPGQLGIKGGIESKGVWLAQRLLDPSSLYASQEGLPRGKEFVTNHATVHSHHAEWVTEERVLCKGISPHHFAHHTPVLSAHCALLGPSIEFCRNDDYLEKSVHTLQPFFKDTSENLLGTLGRTKPQRNAVEFPLFQRTVLRLNHWEFLSGSGQPKCSQ